MYALSTHILSLVIVMQNLYPVKVRIRNDRNASGDSQIDSIFDHNKKWITISHCVNPQSEICICSLSIIFYRSSLIDRLISFSDLTTKKNSYATSIKKIKIRRNIFWCALSHRIGRSVMSWLRRATIALETSFCRIKRTPDFCGDNIPKRLSLA